MLGKVGTIKDNFTNNVSVNNSNKIITPKEIRSWFLTLSLPLIIILLLNAFIFKLVIIKWDSMYPTLTNRDMMIVRQINYVPRQGDIIVIKSDRNSFLAGENIVKRVIALEGQTVEINYESNKVSVNGNLISEPYINHEESDTLKEINEKTIEVYEVPKGCVFVMGDNRNNSLDSRKGNVGFIKTDEIVGNTIFELPCGRWLSALSGNT